MFIGRVHHEGSLTVGKIHPSHGLIYIPFGGVEIPYNHYEVLITTSKSAFGANDSSSDSD